MTVCFAKADRKLHSGRFTYRGFGADVNTFRLNAYGGGERDTRKAASSILGLTVMPHDGQRIDPVATEEREVIPGEVAITKRRLSRGKLAKIRNAAVSGKSLASDEDPILCREGVDGKLVAVRGAHRIAVATMEGMPRTLKVRVAKSEPVTVPAATTPVPAATATSDRPLSVDRLIANPSKLARRMLRMADKMSDATDAAVLAAGRVVTVQTKRLSRAKRAPADELAALKVLRSAVVAEMKRRGIESYSLRARKTAAQDFVTQETGLEIPEPAADSTVQTSTDRRGRIAALREKRRAENNK